MDANAEKKNRKRFRRSAGTLNPEITDNDLFDIFEPLSRHAQLTTSQLIGYGKRYVTKTRGRLGDLYHVTEGEESHYLHRVNEEIRFADHITTEELYRLGEAGRALLVERGIVPEEPWVLNSMIGGRSRAPNRIYRLAHDHMASDIAIDIEIGARKAHDPYDSHIDILKGAPESTRARPKPLKIPVTIDGAETSVEPDSLWRVGDRNYALEADKGGESVNGKTLEGVIAHKVKAYREIVAAGIIDDYLGIDNLTVLFATTIPGRVKSIKQAIGRKSTMFAVLADPRFADFMSAPVPDGRLYSAEWERVGHEPLVIGKIRT
jgi:hypothetical protein